MAAYGHLSLVEREQIARLRATGLSLSAIGSRLRDAAHAVLEAELAAEIAAGAPWSQLLDALERLTAVRYTAEGETIVQASRITPQLAAILKKLDISTPKPILAVG